MQTDGERSLHVAYAATTLTPTQFKTCRALMARNNGVVRNCFPGVKAREVPVCGGTCRALEVKWSNDKVMTFTHKTKS